jgi:hypothetical protein
MCRRTGLVAAVLCAFVMLWMVSPAHAQCTKGSDCQVILSGTGLPATGTNCTPWGMWLWSQTANNGYGNDGNGSMYFYLLAPAEAHVDVGSITLTTNAAGQSVVSETASGTFPNGTSLSCSAIVAHQTSPGKGVLDTLDCTIVSTSGTTTCTITPQNSVPITVNISNAKK